MYVYAGWVGLTNKPASADGHAVQTLRRMGAVLYVKTNVPQSMMVRNPQRKQKKKKKGNPCYVQYSTVQFLMCGGRCPTPTTTSSDNACTH